MYFVEEAIECHYATCNYTYEESFVTSGLMLSLSIIDVVVDSIPLLLNVVLFYIIRQHLYW